MINCTGVILAGGQGSRMNGQDKGMIFFQGKTMYQHVLQRLKPQVLNILISANRNIDKYQISSYQVIIDLIPGYYGPLIGILTGLEYSKTEWVVFCPCDMPWCPTNYVINLWNNKNNSLAVWVKSPQGQNHPTLVLINQKLKNILKKWIFCNGQSLSVMDFLCKQRAHVVTLYNCDEFCFHNINTFNDLITKY